MEEKLKLFVVEEAISVKNQYELSDEKAQTFIERFTIRIVNSILTGRFNIETQEKEILTELGINNIENRKMKSVSLANEEIKREAHSLRKCINTYGMVNYF